MDTAIRYLKYRLFEIPIWLGIPTLGLIASDSSVSLIDLSIFSIAILLSALHVLSLNDWAGLVINPMEGQRFLQGENPVAMAKRLLWISIISYVICLTLFMFLG